MDYDYLIVLFKNKKKHKIIKKYKTLSKALNSWTRIIEENKNVKFCIKTQNGRKVDYDIGLLSKSKKNKIIRADEFGRNIESILDDSEFSFLELIEYKIEEFIFDLQSKKRINFDEFLKNYLNGNSIKLISKLNNKIIVQDDDTFNLFSLKSSDDAERYLQIISGLTIENNKINFLIVKDISKEQKKYLYMFLSNKGINKKILYRNSTTHLKDR